jgi:SAM-dependent methyltransferase
MMAKHSPRAQAVPDIPLDPRLLPDAFKARHTVRMPALDDNSLLDFAQGFKNLLTAVGHATTTESRRAAFLESRGLSDGETELDHKACYDLLMADPFYAARTKLQWTVHDFMFDRSFRAFHRDAERFLAAMEETDESGPGSLTLRPEIDIPDYARHEIHRQAGGFVGDPFAGWVYHYGLTLAYYPPFAMHDEIFVQIAQSHVAPADGVVRRVLDIGCGPGQAATAFKERFPEAEVWGVDIGAPMVRYAHHRAVKLGIDAHFLQGLAEDLPFPDNHFDIVSDHLLFHETDRPAMDKIVREVFRALRPGGVFGHIDAAGSGHPTFAAPRDIDGKAGYWNIHRNNYEPFYLDYAGFDLPTAMREAGFAVDLTSPPVLWNGRPRTIGVKPGGASA